MSVGWAPAPDYVEERLGSLGKRAKKRTGIQTGEHSFTVYGDSKMGDSFDSYDITLDGTKYHCACQDHRGGQYRHLCSHISYVILARRGVVAWAAPYEPPQSHDDGFQNLPDAPLPLFVDSGQVWTEGVREAMDQHFGEMPAPLPDWVKLIRPHQWDAYCEILFHLDGGKKVVFLSAPTGSGKSLIGEMVRRSFADKSAIYTCTTKTLQAQYESDFPYGAVIKGRGNYRTLNNPNAKWLACDLCDIKKVDGNHECSYCDDTEACPYLVARDKAKHEPLAIANVAYLVAEGNTEHSNFRGRDLIILDEADALEDELMRYVEITISPRMQKLLKLDPPEKKTVSDSWQTWVVEEAQPKIRLKLKNMRGYTDDPKDVRLKTTLNRLLAKLETVSLDDDWVYTGYDSGYITFKPIKVDKAAPEVLWNLGKSWLLMSATIISAQQMAEDLGLDDSEWALVEVGSTFAPENRPIYVEPVANMTAKTKETAWPAALKRIKEILDWHDERILIHTVSYKLAQYIASGIGERAITYRDSQERESALAEFRSSLSGVLVAPSFERGIDLPYDECRVVIVAKVPFPYLGDKQISKRLYARGGKGWYAMSTVRALVQMTGRAMRHEDDKCEIYIIDSQFVSSIWKKSKRLLPDWWKEALVMRGSPNLAEVRGTR